MPNPNDRDQDCLRSPTISEELRKLVTETPTRHLDAMAEAFRRDLASLKKPAEPGRVTATEIMDQQKIMLGRDDG